MEVVRCLEVLSSLLNPSLLNPTSSSVTKGQVPIGLPGNANEWDGETGTYCLEDIFKGCEGLRYTQVEEGEDEVSAAGAKRVERSESRSSIPHSYITNPRMSPFHSSLRSSPLPLLATSAWKWLSTT